jgi:endonuclease-3
MLIATILSQNTNDKNSHRAYSLLRARYPLWEDVAEAPMRGVVAAIRSGGMAAQKAARIKEILRNVREGFGGYTLDSIRHWHSDAVLKHLTALKGVGPKTAACVLLFSLGRDLFPVDTHVHRICGRLALAPGARTPEETFNIMRDIVPAGHGYSFHTNLIRFGRKVCRSARPACGECPLQELCVYEGKDTRRRFAQSGADHDFMLLDNVRQ